MPGGHRRIATALFLRHTRGKRKFTPVEQLLSLDLDRHRGGLKSAREYARLWGCTRRTAQARLEEFAGLAHEAYPAKEQPGGNPAESPREHQDSAGAPAGCEIPGTTAPPPATESTTNPEPDQQVARSGAPPSELDPIHPDDHVSADGTRTCAIPGTTQSTTNSTTLGTTIPEVERGLAGSRAPRRAPPTAPHTLIRNKNKRESATAAPAPATAPHDQLSLSVWWDTLTDAARGWSDARKRNWLAHHVPLAFDQVKAEGKAQDVAAAVRVLLRRWAWVERHPERFDPQDRARARAHDPELARVVDRVVSLGGPAERVADELAEAHTTQCLPGFTGGTSCDLLEAFAGWLFGEDEAAAAARTAWLEGARFAQVMQAEASTFAAAQREAAKQAHLRCKAVR